MDRMWEYFATRATLFDRSKLRFKDILDEMQLRPSTGRVVNIGAGDGTFERMAIEEGWEIDSVDPDEPTTSRLRTEGIRAHTASVERMPFNDGYAGHVVASEILEHLTDEQVSAAMVEISRVLSRFGYLYITVPFNEDLQGNVTCCPSCNHVFHRWGHKQSFTKERIRSLLEPAFEVVTLKLTAFVSPFNLKGLSRIILAKLGNQIALPSIYCVARKR